MSTERIDVEALRGRSDIVRITAEGTREVAAQCSAAMREAMHLRAAELDQIANEYDAILAEVIERRARDAAVAELARDAARYRSLRAVIIGTHPIAHQLSAKDPTTEADVDDIADEAIAALQGAQP